MRQADRLQLRREPLGVCLKDMTRQLLSLGFACALLACAEPVVDPTANAAFQLLDEEAWGNGEFRILSSAFPYHVGPPRAVVGSDTVISHWRLADTAAFTAPNASGAYQVRVLGFDGEPIATPLQVHGFAGGDAGPPLWDEDILPWPAGDPTGTFLATNHEQLLLFDPTSGQVITRFPTSVHDPTMFHTWHCPTIPGPSYDPTAVVTCLPPTDPDAGGASIQLWRLSPAVQWLDSLPSGLSARFGAAALGPGRWLLSQKHWLYLIAPDWWSLPIWKEEGLPPVLSPSGDRVVVPAYWDTLKVFETQTPSLAWQRYELGGTVSNATFTLDGAAVVLTSGRRTCAVFVADADDGDLRATVDFCASAAAADPTGQYILLFARTSLTDYTMRVVDARTYTFVAEVVADHGECPPESDAFWVAGMTVSPIQAAAFGILTEPGHLGDTTWAPSAACIMRFDLLYPSDQGPG